MSRGTANKLPETPEDQQFLLELPEHLNMDAACSQVARLVRAGLADPHGLMTVEIVAEVKRAIGLPIESPNDQSATRVISNAVTEAMAMAGYPDPEAIFMQLKERRRALLEASQA